MKDLDAEFLELKADLLALFHRGVGEPLDDGEFNDLALRAFRFQIRANPVYGAFASRRLGDPWKVEGWEEIPPLPTRAFKAAALVSGDPSGVEAVFRTSGTSVGREVRGTHHVRSLALYRGALEPNFRAHLLPEGELLPILGFLPSPAQAPDSSLSFMVGEMGGVGSAFFVHPTEGLRAQALRDALQAAEETGSPVLLAGTAFAFVHWLEVAQGEGWAFHLPSGTRILETGGYKGKVRELPRSDLYRALSRQFGVPVERIVNEYGMTELLSQFYEPVLALGEEGGAGLDGRFHRGPPWVRTRVLHPLSLEPMEEGEVGILTHLDLANLGSVCGILTEDLGRVVQGGFVLRGRVPGAEPRGCSLAMEDFLVGLEGTGHGL